MAITSIFKGAETDPSVGEPEERNSVPVGRVMVCPLPQELHMQTKV